MGLEGVSSHTITGPSPAACSTAAATRSASAMSTTACRTPHGARTFEISR